MPRFQGCSTNPLAEKSSRISANSFIGRARSLFGAEVISRVRDLVDLPNPLPFGVKVERVHVPRYRSGFNVETLLESAREELAHCQARTVQNLSPGRRDGWPTAQRNRQAALDRVPLG